MRVERRATMKGIAGVHPDWGITVVRLMTGLVFAIHGYQKFAGGIDGVTAFFTKAAIPFPGLMAPFIAILELVGGILLILGVATRVVACLFAVEMLVTTFWVIFPGRGWNASELDRMLLVACVLLVLAGPGAAALDRLWWEREEVRKG
jgi:putative oxidoreductase